MPHPHACAVLLLACAQLAPLLRTSGRAHGLHRQANALPAANERTVGCAHLTQLAALRRAVVVLSHVAMNMAGMCLVFQKSDATPKPE